MKHFKRHRITLGTGREIEKLWRSQRSDYTAYDNFH